MFKKEKKIQASFLFGQPIFNDLLLRRLYLIIAAIWKLF
jgi:hypothetical protein